MGNHEGLTNRVCVGTVCALTIQSKSKQPRRQVLAAFTDGWYMAQKNGENFTAFQAASVEEALMKSVSSKKPQ